MASSIPSLLGRKVLPAAVALTAGGGVASTSLSFDDVKAAILGGGKRASTASCEAPRFDEDKSSNPFLAPRLPETTLRKRMTSVGRFSLKSETESNRSIPTFFLALSGEKRESPAGGSPAVGSGGRDVVQKFSPRKIFTVNDFEEAWMRRGMPSRHPRFHSTVCSEGQYFEETHHIHPPGNSDEADDDEASLRIKAELDRHASETMHFSVYRDDLRNRIESMLTSPIEVSDKLWEVKISNGLLGSSGAISKAKTGALLKQEQKPKSRADGGDIGEKRSVLQRRKTWKDAALEAKSIPMESVLLFRSHHALADGASIMAALSDLCDEAEDIRMEIEAEMAKRKRRRGGKDTNVLKRLLRRMVRFAKLCAWFYFGTIKALIYQGYLQLTTLRNPFDAVREDAKKKGLALSGRSISWVDAAPLEEAKQITNIISKAKGVKLTINDLFVSCVTSAVTRQLIEHEEFMAPVDAHARKFVVPNINVVVPVHMRGGVVLPGESVGNNIGAFVTRCPGEMKHDATGGGTAPCPIERLQQVHKSLLRSKHSPAPLISHYMAKFCSDWLPESWAKAAFQRANANACVVVSNNRGHKDKIHIGGMAVESAAGFLPLPPGIPIGVVVQSYAGSMSMSVTAERWAVPDADKFLRWVLDEYQRLREEATRLEKEQK